MSPRAIVCVCLALAGVLILVAGAWARSGAFPGSRFWMNPDVEDWQAERFVILGAPIGGIGLGCVAAIGAPIASPVLLILGVAGLVALAPAALYFVLAPIPLARWMFPRWARELREQRKRRYDMLFGRR